LGVQLVLADPSKNVILRKLEDLAPDTPQQPTEPSTSGGGKNLATIDPGAPGDFGDFDPAIFADIMPEDLGSRYANQFRYNSAKREFDNIISAAADKTGVPFEMIRAVIGAESAFNPRAYSSADAAGIMQFITSTAAGYGMSPDDRYDPEIAIPAGAKLLKDLYNQFGNWPEAVAAYNAGPGNVSSGRWLGFKETRNYVPTVMAYYHAEGGRGYT
jgi:soluble lytic murein transglycosylase-like protein